VARIEPLAGAGFRTFKWKVGVAPVGEELPLLDDVCAELPTGARLRLDANGAWDRRAAERWLERCAERPVEFVEQPCFADPAQGAAEHRRTEDLLRGLAADYPTAIALDESLSREGDVERWIEAGWRGVWVIKPSLTGGAVTMARLRRADADVVFSSALETAVGARAALRVAFAWGKTQRALGFGVWPLFQDARFDGPHRAPFLWARDVERINVEAAWNALS
jgi:O-succinylbenzoate synthase